MLWRFMGLVLVFFGFTAFASKARAATVDNETIELLVNRINAEEFGNWFDVKDVLALIEIESAGDPRALRREPELNDASRGLMQILLSSARDRGFTGTPAELFDSETNIRFGMAHLKWSWDFLNSHMPETPSRDLWIGSYNAGVGNALKGYTPQSYVAKFRAARARL